MLTALHIAIVLAAIVIGARLGSIAIGFAGGLGVLLLGLTGVPVSREDIPFDVIGIIMSVIAAIAAMQKAGGMDYLVAVAEKLLRKNPKHVTYLAPVATYLMTVLAGTGHTAFSTLPLKWRSLRRRSPQQSCFWPPSLSPTASATSNYLQ